MPVLTQTQVNWTALLQHLDIFVNDWQGNSGYQTLDAGQHLLIYRLYAGWRQENEEPLDLETYGYRLRALLCKNAQQQMEFMPLWWDCWDRGKTKDKTLTQALEASSKKPETAESWYQEANRAINKRSKSIVLAMLLLLISQFAGLLPQTQQQLSPDPVSKHWTKVFTDHTIYPLPPPPNPEKPYLNNVPQRQPPPAITLGVLEKQAITDKRNQLFLGSTLVILIGMAWLWRQRKVGFERQLSRAPDQDQLGRKLPMQSFADQFLPNFSTALAKLRFAKVGLNKIHWGKTIAATARSGGFVQLRFTDRYRQADIVLLTDNRHRHDQTGYLMDKLHAALKQAQLRVHYYDFERVPDWLWAEGDRSQKPIELERLLAKHQQSRVLLVSEHTVLFYRLSGEIQDWLTNLHQHSHYQLGLLTKPNANQQNQLQKGDYRYRLVNDSTDLKALLDFETPDTDKHAKPGALPPFDTDWLGNSLPQATGLVVDWITKSIGLDGIRYLKILAMYPKLEGDLSQALFQHFTQPKMSVSHAKSGGIWQRLHSKLSPAKPTKSPTKASSTESPTGQANQPPITAKTFIKVMTLPWCRQGWLPLWLRRLLLQNMVAADYRLARQFFIDLFDKNTLQDGKAQVKIQKPASFWQRIPWLWHLNKKANYDSPLRDQIFTRILLLPHNPLERLPLAKRLLNALPNTVFSLWEPILGMCLVASLLMAMVYGLWAWQGESYVAQPLLQAKRQQHMQTTVHVRYHSAAKALKDQFVSGLKGLGYPVAVINDDSIAASRITAPAAMINDLNQAAVYLSWGAEFKLRTEDPQAVLELATMPQTGQVFRDYFPNKLQLNTDYSDPNPSISPKTVTESPVVTIDPTIKPILPTMVNIPSGQFMMGSPYTDKVNYEIEKPQNRVSIAAFQLAATELTFTEWDQCVKAKACRDVSDQGWGRGKRPMINVSWDDAKVYINWLNDSQVLLQPQSYYRLPSESEWEYAARAGTTSPFYLVNAKACDYANGDDESEGCKDGYDNTAPVGSFKPNAWGLYDMSGNVWEWVEDCWHDNYQNAPTDGSAWQDKPSKCAYRSIRGGGWSFVEGNLSFALQSRGAPDGSSDDLGFRLARTP